MPSWMPTSSGTKEKASGTALPTRNTSAAWARAKKPNATATLSAVAAMWRSVLGRQSILRFLRSSDDVFLLFGQKCIGDKLAHVRLFRQGLHFDEGTPQDRHCFR